MSQGTSRSPCTGPELSGSVSSRTKRSQSGPSRSRIERRCKSRCASSSPPAIAAPHFEHRDRGVSISGLVASPLAADALPRHDASDEVDRGCATEGWHVPCAPGGR